MNKICFGIGLIFGPGFLYSCRHIDDASSRPMAASVQAHADIDCGGAEYSPFILEPLAFAPNLATVQQILPQIIKTTPPVPGINIRLDTCVDSDNKIDIKGLVYSSKDKLTGPFRAIPQGKVVGAEDALIGSTYKSLSGTFKLSTAPSANSGKYELRGVSDQDKSYAVFYDPSDAGTALTGRFVYGDFPTIDGCTAGEKQNSWVLYTKLSGGMITEKVVKCSSEDWEGPGTTKYRIAKYSITDTSSLLPAEIRGKEFVFSTDELVKENVFTGTSSGNKKLHYQVNHHNSCDAYEVVLDHAVYAFTYPVNFSMSTGACNGFGDAPKRKEGEPDSVAYRIIYKNSQKIDGYTNRPSIHQTNSEKATVVLQTGNKSTLKAIIRPGNGAFKPPAPNDYEFENAAYETCRGSSYDIVEKSAKPKTLTSWEQGYFYWVIGCK